MGKMRSHRDLVVWQRAMTFVQRVYEATESFPPHETYNLVSQLRRAAVSIPANLAEGHGRRTDGAFARHVDIALGSTAEVDTLLQLAHDLGYLSQEHLEILMEDLEQIGRMLQSLYKTLRTQNSLPTHR